MQNIKIKFSRILKYMGVSEKDICMDTSFKKDLEFNDFQFSFLHFYISNYFNIQISTEEYHCIDTIGNTLIFIQEKQQGNL